MEVIDIRCFVGNDFPIRNISPKLIKTIAYLIYSTTAGFFSFSGANWSEPHE